MTSQISCHVAATVSGSFFPSLACDSIVILNEFIQAWKETYAAAKGVSLLLEELLFKFLSTYDSHMPVEMSIEMGGNKSDVIRL